MSMIKISQRLIYSLGCLLSIGAIAFAYYLQIYKGLEPCPLCIVQRLLIGLLGVLCAIGIFWSPSRPWARCSYNGLISLIALAGAASAGHKIWLEHLPPDQVPDCGPGLQYMLDHLPFHKTLNLLLKGSGECSQVEWQFLNITLSEWTLLCFIVFIGVGVYNMTMAKIYG
jgi:disulfide bond formation protein DsbB